MPPRSSSFPSCVAFWKVGESAKNIDKGNPQSLVPIFSSSCSCRRNFVSHDPFLFLTALPRSVPVRAPCYCFAFWGEKRKQIIGLWRRCPAQFRCQLEFHSCFYFVDCAFFLVSIFMMKAATLASNICVFQSCRCSMRSFWDRKVCVFGFYLFVISIFFSLGRIEIACCFSCGD